MVYYSPENEQFTCPYCHKGNFNSTRHIIEKNGGILYEHWSCDNLKCLYNIDYPLAPKEKVSKEKNHDRQI